METPEKTPVWLEIWEASKTNRRWFKCGLWAYSTVVYWGAICLIHISWSGAVGLVMLLPSFLPLFLMGWLWEDRREWAPTTVRFDGKRSEPVTRSQLQKLSFKTQSWAFLADTYGLAPMAAFGAHAFLLLPHNSFFTGRWWWAWGLANWIAGKVVAAVFARGEGERYDVLRRNSCTKLIHNGSAFSVLFGVMSFTLIPIVATGGFSCAALWSWLAVSGFGLWLMSAAADGWRGNLKPDSRFYEWALLPSNLHSQVDAQGHTLDVELPDVPMWNAYRETPTGATFDLSDILHTRRLIELAGRFLRPRKG